MLLRQFSVLAAAMLLAGCQAADATGARTANSSADDTTATASADGGKTANTKVVQASGERITPVPKDELPQTEAEWKEKLTPEQFNVLRKHGTEPAFSSKDTTKKTDGIYHCAGCGEPLFNGDTKFDSGTGWPSFYDVIGDVGDHVGTQADRSLFVTRTEVHCQRCGGHLGHVFEDGPAPTGLRYCMNSVSLKLGPKDSSATDSSAASEK